MKFKQLIEQREVKESYDDYHGDMSKDDYDKTVKSSEMEYTVWVGGTEVNDTWLSYDDAVRLYDKYKAQGYDDVQLDARIKESVNEAEKRWKQTSMSPEEAIAKYGKENVKVKKGALRNGDDMVEVFVESYSPGDEYADSEGMVSNCCGAPMMDYNDGHGRCGDCKEMAAGETEEDFYENTYDTKDFEVNPRAGHRDQMAHPENQIGLPGIKTKPKLRPKNLQMKYDINKAVNKAVKEDDDDGMLRRQDGEYDKDEIRQMQYQQNVADPLNREIDASQKAHTIEVDYDLELDKPKSKNPLLKKHYKEMRKFNVFISMPEWQEGPKDSGFGAWTAKVRGSKKNLLGWLKAWEFDYDKEELADMGLGESMNEDEEAIAARDEFMKVMDMKPKSSNKAIDTIKKIVADKQNMQVKFDDGKMKVDLYTASAVSQVYDAVNDANKEKLDNMLRTKEGMLRLSNFAFSKLSEQVQVMENAEKEGRLDEVLPIVPLAIGAARVLGPMAAKAIAKKFGKKAVKNAAGKFKPGMNPNSVKTQIKPGAGDSVTKQILKKSPGLKTTATISGSDIMSGGDGTGSTAIGNAVDYVTGGSNSSNSSSSSSNYSKDNKYNKVNNRVNNMWGENISEYAGKDVVYDKNGKPHDPNSPKGKTIVNMKCNNPNVKDKEGCGTGIDKDKKRRNMALLKKGAGMAKTGAKKLGKAAVSSVTATGFANPFEAIEAKATKMIEDAVEKTEKMPKIDPSKIKTPTNIKVTSIRPDGKSLTSKDKKMPGDHHPDLKLSAKVLF